MNFNPKRNLELNESDIDVILVYRDSKPFKVIEKETFMRDSFWQNLVCKDEGFKLSDHPYINVLEKHTFIDKRKVSDEERNFYKNMFDYTLEDETVTEYTFRRLSLEIGLEELAYHCANSTDLDSCRRYEVKENV